MAISFNNGKFDTFKKRLQGWLGLKKATPKSAESTSDTGTNAPFNSATSEVKPGFLRRWFHRAKPIKPANPTSGLPPGLKSLYRSAAGYAQRRWKRLWSREEAISINDVLKAESEEIKESRKIRMAGVNIDEDIANVKGEKIERGCHNLEPEVNEVRDDRFVGVCFSGGGIRSATFNLGVTTALAKNGYLKQIDYLSTVSGGGYIGSWLTAWIKRKGCLQVEETLKKKTATPDGRYLEPDPVRFLRKYSNYLAPRTGLLSTDLWALLAVYLRNVMLNVALLIAVGAFILALPLLGVHYGWTLAGRNLQGIFLALTRMFLVIAMGAIAYSFASFSSKVMPRFKIAQSIVNRPGLWVVTPLFLAAVLMTYVLNQNFGNKLSCIAQYFTPPISAEAQP